MTNDDYYKIYQSNLTLLEQEISQVKFLTQSNLGKATWLENNGNPVQEVEATNQKVLASTRLYTFLICSWFEARLFKMLYENSSNGFTDTEIEQIRTIRNMSKKWQLSFSLAVQHSYGFTSTDISIQNFSSRFTPNSPELNYYTYVSSLFNLIDDAVTIRNRLAHGQWEIQFNNANTATVNYPFIQQYGNIQKLEQLKSIFNTIASIINMYVTYKDKHNTNFQRHMDKYIDTIQQAETRINTSDFNKYKQRLSCSYKKQHDKHN